MKTILSSTWGASVLSAIFGAALVALIGIATQVPSTVTIFAAVLFGALLVFILQLSVVIAIIWQSRHAKNDIGEAMMQEIESPAGQAQLKKMDFVSLLTVAIVQELHLSLFKRDEPLWLWHFIGIGENVAMQRDFGALNRYLEWALVVGLVVFTFGTTILFTIFANSVASVGCAIPAFILGFVLLFCVGLFIVSVIRRLFILYATRADVDNIA